MTAKEDYLRIIYKLEDGGEARSVDIATALKVSKASVSEMLRKLAEDKLVKISPYSKIKLTKKGRREAEKLYNKHDVVKEFLSMLGHKDEELISGAHKLEHAFSDESVEKLKAFMGKPRKQEMVSYIG